jgi:hypothetical protein
MRLRLDGGMHENTALILLDDPRTTRRLVVMPLQAFLDETGLALAGGRWIAHGVWL